MATDKISQTVLFPELFDRPVVATFDREQASSDGGAVLLKAAERVYGLVKAFAGCLADKRAPGKIRRLRLAGRGEKIHEKVCRYGGRVPIREVWRARAMTAAVRRVLGLSETLGTCASSASNETRRS